MSPYVVRDDRDEGSAAVAVAVLVIVAVVAVLVIGYFVWYAPGQRVQAGDTDIDVTVPRESPDVDVNVPQSPPDVDVNVPQSPPANERAPSGGSSGNGDEAGQ